MTMEYAAYLLYRSLKGFALVAGIYEASRNNMGPGTLSLDECNHRARFTFQPEGGGADRSFYRKYGPLY